VKVSVQIPTYNQAHSIGKAIESALMQDYPELEIIVQDDCSSDDTFSVASSFSSDLVKVYRNETNIGRVSNYRSLLYERVSGNWNVNLDGDDYFSDPAFISRAVAVLKSNPDLVFYQSCIASASDNGSFRFRHKLTGDREEILISGKEYFSNFHRNEFFGHLSTVYNSELARKVGFYQYNSIIADAESLLKLALNGSVFLDNRITGVWNIHGANESKSMLSQNDLILASFRRLKDYSVPYIGAEAAENWYEEAIAINKASLLELRARYDFRRFLAGVRTSDLTKTALWKILIKKTLGRI